MNQSTETARALLGTLLLVPAAHTAAANAGVTPDMFPAVYDTAARFIWDTAAEGRGWDVASVADAAGWDRETKNEVLRAANPDLVDEHAAGLVESYLSRMDSQLLNEFSLKLEAGDEYWETMAELDYRRDKLRADIQVWKDRKGDMIREALNRISKARTSQGLSGISTGWGDTDRFLGGWQPGDLIILAARPGMGKTTVMMHHARHAALAGHRVGIFSLEMTGVQLIQKWIAEQEGITTGALRNGAVSSKQWDVIQENAAALYDLPVYFEDFADAQRITASVVRDRARMLHDRYGVDLFFVDYLQLMSGQDRRESRNYQVEEISRTMKGIAKSLDVPVIVLSQLSRDVEKRGGAKRPILSDLRDSGSLEQDADIIMFLYRPEYYKIYEDESGESLVGVMEYIISKDRIGGHLKTFTRHWHGAQYLARRPDDDDQAQVPAPADLVTSKGDPDEELPF